MNKQELIKRIEDLPYKEGPIADTITINRNWMLESIKQLGEPKKVQIPQFVADWLKKNDWREDTSGEQSVFDVFDNLKNDSKNGYYKDVKRWIDENGDLFARAWLDGYTIEEERRYLVKVKGMSEENTYLTFRFGHTWMLSNFEECEEFRLHHTRKQLEEAGFAWVFDCEGIAIEEVE